VTNADPSPEMIDPLSAERTLLEARRRLASMRAALNGSAAPADADGGSDGGGVHDSRARGTALDGRIAVTAEFGRIRGVELDPRVLRLGTGELAAHLVTAVNTALGELRAPDVPAAVNLRAVARELEEFRAGAMRQMNEITHAVADAVAQFRPDGQVSGGVEVPDFDGLLAELAGVLAPIAAAQDRGSPGEEGEDAGGVAEAGDGLVRAVAADGRIVSMEIDARAVRAGSQAMAGWVAAVVNAALDDPGMREPSPGAVPAVDRPELTRRLQDIQDRGLSELRSLGSSLAGMMSTMRPAPPSR
jgi:hypothetical protein